MPITEKRYDAIRNTLKLRGRLSIGRDPMAKMIKRISIRLIKDESG